MKREIPFIHQVIPVVIFILMIIYGLAIQPLVLKHEAMPIEIIMVLSSIIVSAYIIYFTDVTWAEIQASMVKKIAEALPGLLVLLVIGITIGAFIMAGTMAMMVSWGIKAINPKYIYLVAFILPVIFSTFTGTSWGSAATIGVVLMGIGLAIKADPAIMAGAIVSGSYFGDKMSPLSDTTNIAAIAANVDLYDHIRSMFYSTIPASILAIIVYTIAGFVYPPQLTDITDPRTVNLLANLEGMFHFNVFLLLPIVVVMYGSYKKYPTLPVMIVTSIVGYLIAIIFQQFSVESLLSSVGHGFHKNMITWYTPTDTSAIGIFERGGYWELAMLLPISIAIIAFVAILSTIDAMSSLVNRLFSWAKTSKSIVIASILSSAALIGITANGIACSFVTCDIFGKKYDDAGIDRRVLSRTCEDTGTLLEVLFPWTPAAIFFVKTLGVPVSGYLPWSILNFSTPFVAIILALTGFGIFKAKKPVAV